MCIYIYIHIYIYIYIYISSAGWPAHGASRRGPCWISEAAVCRGSHPRRDHDLHHAIALLSCHACHATGPAQAEPLGPLLEPKWCQTDYMRQHHETVVVLIVSVIHSQCYRYVERRPDHRHQDLKAFEKHVQKHVESCFRIIEPADCNHYNCNHKLVSGFPF